MTNDPYLCTSSAACPAIPGFQAFKGRDIIGGDISCSPASEERQAGVTQEYVSGLTRACEDNRQCNAFSFNSKPGMVASCLKRHVSNPDAHTHYPNICYYKRTKWMD